MLTNEQANDIWNSLEHTGEALNKKYGERPIRQSVALDELVTMTISRRALEAKEAFTRGQILEAYCLFLMQRVARLNGYSPINEMN